MKKFILAIISIFICNGVYGSSSKYFMDSTRDAFMKGDAKNVSITKQGELVLSPSFVERARIRIQ